MNKKGGKDDDSGNVLNFDGDLAGDHDWLDDPQPLSDQFKQAAEDEDNMHDDFWRTRMEQRKVFAEKKGRIWGDTWEIPEILESTMTYEEIPDWTPEAVSPVSRDRVQVLPEKIPTVAQLARLPLPPPIHPHPTFPRAYAFARDRELAKRVQDQVVLKAEPRVAELQRVALSAEEKQERVDELFETVEFELKQEMEVLGRHPSFGTWVEKSLEAYLTRVNEDSNAVLFGQVLEAIQDKTDKIVDTMATLATSEDKLDTAKKLFDSVVQRDQAVKLAVAAHKDHPLFLFWAKKALDQHLDHSAFAAREALAAELDPLVRDKLESNPLHLSSLEGLTGLALRRKRNEVVKEIKAELEKEQVATVARFHLLKWLRKSFKEYLYEQVATQVWQKLSQSAIDPNEYSTSLKLKELADIIQLQLQQEEFPLVQHELMGAWVKRAIEQQFGDNKEIDAFGSYPSSEEASKIPPSAVELIVKAVRKEQSQTKPPSEYDGPYPTPEQDSESVPIFMDVYNKDDGFEDDNAIPKILYPLDRRERQTLEGRMIEEWELAALKDSKRIMLRESMRKIAQVLDECEETPRRVLVHGRRGVGKTATLAAMVASARKSGHLVMYIPDANQLHQFGYYIEPSPAREGMWNLPMLSQELLERLVHFNRDDIKEFSADRELLKTYFTEDQVEELPEGDSIDLAALCDFAQDNVDLAAGCYDTVLHVLMNQEEKPFDIFIDEFNIFYKKSEYYHGDYDYDVINPIPYPIINLFKPILDAMALTIEDDGEKILSPQLMKKGAIVAATSLMHPVPKRANEYLLDNAKRSLAQHSKNLAVVEVPRLTKLEVDHMIANYECIGLGHLRLDEGKTVNDPNEMEFFRVMSSGVAQNLMNVCHDLT